MTFTALARTSTPRIILSRASCENFTSLADMLSHSIRHETFMGKRSAPVQAALRAGLAAPSMTPMTSLSFMISSSSPSSLISVPRPFAEQDAVARLEVERDELALLVARAGADGDDLAFLRLLLGGVGNDDAALGLLFRVEAPDDHAIVQRTKLHELLLVLVVAQARPGLFAFPRPLNWAPPICRSRGGSGILALSGSESANDLRSLTILFSHAGGGFLSARRAAPRRWRVAPMCRGVRTLHNFAPPASDEEISAAARPFARQLGGFALLSRARAVTARRSRAASRPSRSRRGAAASRSPRRSPALLASSDAEPEERVIVTLAIRPDAATTNSTPTLPALVRRQGGGGVELVGADLRHRQRAIVGARCAERRRAAVDDRGRGGRGGSGGGARPDRRRPAGRIVIATALPMSVSISA